MKKEIKEIKKKIKRLILIVIIVNSKRLNNKDKLKKYINTFIKTLR